MRNPAPIVLSLLLAAVAAFFIFKKSDPPAAPAVPEEEASATPVEEESAAAVIPEAAASEVPEPIAAAVTPVPWPQGESDIPVDPEVVFGNLPNGMRYLIMPNAEPPNRVSVRLHIAAGSLMEREDQRGVAHFLEHMVFNGSKNFSADELIPQMQRLGIGFGAHVNAYTSWEETVYMLDLPDVSKSMLDLGFTVMRDFGDGALLKIEEIDKERGVILSEKTSRDSVQFRMMEKQFAAILPGSLITERFPIGLEEIIRTAPRERFTDFYNDYYIPERMTFVVVGNIDPAEMVKRIESSFGSMVNPETPGEDPKVDPVTSPEGLEAAVFTDPELSGTDLELLIVGTYIKKLDTKEERISEMPLNVANSIIGQRFSRLSKKEGSPVLEGSASRNDLFNRVELGSINVTVADDRWQDALPVMEQEFRRAVTFGFTKAEVAEAKANYLNAYQQAVKGKDSRHSDQLATGIARTISAGTVLSTPEIDLEIVEVGLEAVTAESCQKAFVDFWKDQGMRLILTTKDAPEGSVEELARIYEASRLVEITAPEEKEMISFAYTEFGSAGEIESEEVIEDLGITRIRLKNGITINLKPTDFEKNSILINANIGRGKLTQPEGKIGISDFANAVIAGGGIGEHSDDDLQQIFAGKNIGFGFSVGDDSFSLSGQTTPDDLELQLQAMAAQLTKPGYHQESVTQFRKAIPMIFQEIKHTPKGPMNQMRKWLRGGDPRFVFPDSPDELLAYEVDDIKAWLEEKFSNGAIELSLVGDFDPEKALSAVLSTFGALPERKPLEKLAEGARMVKFPKAPQTKTFLYQTKIPQGQSLVLWKTPGPRRNEETFRRLNLLSTILGDRLRKEIREKLGASYSPRAVANGSDALDDYGFLIAMSIGTPEDIDRLAKVAVNLGDKLAKEGADQDELDRARTPLLADIDKTLRDNSYWLGTVLAGSSDYSRKFELARNRKSDLESITLKEINELAAKYLTEQNAIQVLIKPDNPDKPEADKE